MLYRGRRALFDDDEDEDEYENENEDYDDATVDADGDYVIFLRMHIYRYNETI